MSSKIEVTINTTRETSSGTFLQPAIKEHTCTHHEVSDFEYDKPRILTTDNGTQVTIKVLPPATPAVTPAVPNTITIGQVPALIGPTIEKATLPWRVMEIGFKTFTLFGIFGTKKGLFGFLGENCRIASTYLSPVGGACIFYGGQRMVSVLSDVISTKTMSTAERIEEVAFAASFFVLGGLSLLQTHNLC